jgi:uncharacterized membrane protein (DUF2068 family)
VVTRFWPDGLLIDVACDTLATPASLTLRGRRHSIACVVERWRVDEGWWQKRAWREYFQLITTSSLLVLVFHDVRSGQWFLQRVYD